MGYLHLRLEEISQRAEKRAETRAAAKTELLKAHAALWISLTLFECLWQKRRVVCWCGINKWAAELVASCPTQLKKNEQKLQ